MQARGVYLGGALSRPSKVRRRRATDAPRSLTLAKTRLCGVQEVRAARA
jgi:hypothetical protein